MTTSELSTSVNRAAQPISLQHREAEILDTIPEGVAVASDDRIAYVNKAFANLFRYQSMAELMNARVSDLLLPANDQQLPGEPTANEYVRGRCNDGVVIDLETNVSSIVIDGKECEVVTVRQATHRRPLDPGIVEAQKMQSIGNLAAGIAHDFNNILAIIMGYASRLAESEPAPEERRRYAATITKTAERGAELVNQLVTFAQGGDRTSEVLGINDQLTLLRSMLAAVFPKTIDIRVAEAEAGLQVAADRALLQQLFLNISLNARDAMPQGGRYTVTCTRLSGTDVQKQFPDAAANHYVLLEFVDSGSGMDQETRTRAFSPFFTTKLRGKGTGLGLAVAYGIVKMHSGFIDLQSKPQEGTRVSVYFPGTGATVPANEAKRRSILLVDDEAYFLDLLKMVLEEQGYDVITATDGEEAIEVFQKHRTSVDLVIIDLGLPKVNGWDAFVNMRGLEPNVKGILISGDLFPPLRKQLQEVKMLELLLKPFHPNDLVLKIENVMKYSTAS